MNTMTLGKAVYCNWLKGPQHRNQCANPTQCYCFCHQPKALTIHKLKKEIEYHQRKITILSQALEEKSKWS